MSKNIEPAIPKRLLNDIFTEQPNRANWSEELTILLDPNIRARSFTPPSVGSIEITNHDFKYQWCRLKMGPNADTSRYMQLKALGFQNATTDDVKVINADIIDGKTEIRSGDRILVKAPHAIVNGLKKQYMLDAIAQTSRAARGEYQEVQQGVRMSQQDRVMRTADYGQAASVNLTTGEQEGNVDIASMMRKSNPGNTSVAKTSGGK